MRRIAFHPPLWALWPAAALWSENWRVVTACEVLPLVGVVLTATLAGWVFVRALGLVWIRAALVVSGLAIGLQLLGLLPGGPAMVLLAAAALIAALVASAMRLSDDVFATVTFVLNIASTAVLAVALVPVLLGWFRAPTPLSIEMPSIVSTAAPAQRDVLYVIPDRFGRADVLRAHYDWDLEPFLTALEDRGFDIAEQSAANYPKTAHSLAAAWNLDYLNHVAADVPEGAASDLRLLNPLLRHHHLGAIAVDLGYDYLHVGSWWAPTTRASSATQVLTRPGPSQFAKVHLDRTLVPSLFEVVPGLHYEDFRMFARAHAEHGLTVLEDLGRHPDSKPRFVISHLTLPHDPYVFEPDGSWVPEALERHRSRAENYRRQLEFTEAALLDVIDAWLDRPEAEQPIIVVQADEGPHPRGLFSDPFGFTWVDAADDEQREKLAILTALHLPGTDVEVPETLSPVNTFRLVLDAYHGTELGLLPDRSYVYTSESELYRFTDVSSTVQ